MRLASLLSVLIFSACSPLTVPGAGRSVEGSQEAMAVLSRSAAVAGDPWKSYRKVEVAYEGEWTGIAKRVQPELVDAEYRVSSMEVYEPSSRRVEQLHRGPGGVKRVIRVPGKVEVDYEGVRSGEVGSEARDAAALVADAYTSFLFGASWLRVVGKDLGLLETEELDGELCDRVQGRLAPGFGFSKEDRFIAWVGRDSGWLRRLQFTIEGLESTRGTDVEVRFLDHWEAADGSIWPGSFVEWVQRPIRVKAHEWRMTDLKADGRRLK